MMRAASMLRSIPGVPRAGEFRVKSRPTALGAARGRARCGARCSATSRASSPATTATRSTRIAITLVAVSCIGGMPEQVVGTVRIHAAEPASGGARGSRCTRRSASMGRIGAALIRLAVVQRACARLRDVFLAHVQSQNAPLFEQLHWTTLEELDDARPAAPPDAGRPRRLPAVLRRRDRLRLAARRGGVMLGAHALDELADARCARAAASRTSATSAASSARSAMRLPGGASDLARQCRSATTARPSPTATATCCSRSKASSSDFVARDAVVRRLLRRDGQRQRHRRDGRPADRGGRRALERGRRQLADADAAGPGRGVGQRYGVPIVGGHSNQRSRRGATGGRDRSAVRAAAHELRRAARRPPADGDRSARRATGSRIRTGTRRPRAPARRLRADLDAAACTGRSRACATPPRTSAWPARSAPR